MPPIQEYPLLEMKLEYNFSRPIFPWLGVREYVGFLEIPVHSRGILLVPAYPYG